MHTSIAKLSDKALIDAVQRTCLASKALLAEMIVLLIEVEDRSIHLKEAYPSMFAYCRGALRMSEGEAFRRITAARLVKRFPKLLPRIERDDIHLSALVQLRDYFHDANVDHLVDAAKGKNKFEIAEMVARLAPRAAGRAGVRKLPHHDKRPNVSPARTPSLEPLADALYRLQVFGDRVFRDKLFRARDLLMHANPTGDLSIVVSRALDALLASLEKRFGKGEHAPRGASLEPVAAVAPPREVQPGEKRAQPPSVIGPHPSLVRTVAESRRDEERTELRRNGSSSAPPARRGHFRQRNGASAGGNSRKGARAPRMTSGA